MISELFSRFNVRLEDISNDSPAIAANAPRVFDLFRVDDARGNASVPDQEEFVVRYGIRSVIGFGGTCRHGDLFVIMIFSKCELGDEFARKLRTLALDVVTSVFRFGNDAIFEGSSAP